MQLHASCAARDGTGVLLMGPPGSGKSDLLLRLLDHGFTLLADDRVDLDGDIARPPERLAGLLEVRGLGILTLPFTPSARIILAVALERGERLPEPDSLLGVPLVRIDPGLASAATRVAAAWSCAAGHIRQLAGAFA